MKTSRKDGILVFDIKNPYKIAIDGEKQERKEIICHDVTSKNENAAFDLEQMIMTALTSIPDNGKKTSKKQASEDEADDSTFFDSDSPSAELVNKQAMGFEMLIKMNKAVQVSEIVNTFKEFVDTGAVCMTGNIPMNSVVWDGLSRTDKLSIVFKYCAFFVNPLATLRNMDL